MQLWKYIFLRNYTGVEGCVFHLDYMLHNKSHNWRMQNKLIYMSENIPNLIAPVSQYPFLRTNDIKIQD